MIDENTNIRIMELREMMKSATDDIISDQQQGLPQECTGGLCLDGDSIPK